MVERNIYPGGSPRPYAPMHNLVTSTDRCLDLTGPASYFASAAMKTSRKLSSPRELSLALVRSRRDFLRASAGLALGSTLLHTPFARAVVPAKKRKVVVITFGGGARDQETFASEGQENIPNLMRELIPQSTFFT